MKIDKLGTGTFESAAEGKKLYRQVQSQVSTRTARLKTRQMLQYLMMQGYMFNRQECYLLIKNKILTRKEIQIYKRRIKIAEKHWWYDVSPLREARKHLRSGIPASQIHQYADALARTHPLDMYHEYYAEKIREEMQPVQTQRIEIPHTAYSYK